MNSVPSSDVSYSDVKVSQVNATSEVILDHEISSTKKKKVKKIKSDPPPIDPSDEEAFHKKKKSKSKNKKKTCEEPETADALTYNDKSDSNDALNHDDETQHKKEKKKSKKKTTRDDTQDATHGAMGDCDSQTLVEHRNRKHKKRKRSETVGGDDIVDCNGSVLATEPLVNKRKTKTSAVNNVTDDGDVDKKKRKLKKKATASEIIANEEMSNDHKSKKKKSKSKKLEAAAELVESNATVRKKSKKKKHKTAEVPEVMPVESTVCDGSFTEKQKKRKRKHVAGDTEDVDAVLDSGKKRKKNKTQMNDHIKLSEDGVPENANTADTSCGKTACVSPDKEGQWGSVSLGNATRTDKFLRLMGAQKAGNSSASSQGAGKKATRALTAVEEQALNRRLEEQFVNAKQSIILKGKGVGLGFEKPPGEGKKFYIDVSQTKSKKFDD